jgi:threonine synthase
MGKVKSLRCRECGKAYPPLKIYACEQCFGPLEVEYDYSLIELDQSSFEDRRRSLWRYFEFLPIASEKHIIDLGAGYTPLHKCDGLAKELGVRAVYAKDDTVNPTHSFKDRPASVATSKAVEFGVKGVACPSTGNLASAVAAHAAKVGMPCYIIIPTGLEREKVVQAMIYGARTIAIRGTYDDANRLATQIAEKYDLAFANIDLRPYYMEGSKTLAFETCEQLGWRPPDRIIVPTASGGLLYATWKGLQELREVGLVDEIKTKITCAQPEGCSPIVNAFKLNKSWVEPVESPSTVAKSLAIGNPSDGIYALKVIRASGGVAESATDGQIIDAMKLLARREGIFAEPAGAVTIAVLRRLVEEGEIAPDEEVVCFITGDGLKTADIVLSTMKEPITIEPTLDALMRVMTGG